jgi:hypothetical protein
MSDWEEIETAPTDGTPILCCWKGKNLHPYPMHCEGGKFGILTHDGDFIVSVNQPTHWMDFPEPPK